ncbi:heterokaryon incompatibility protein-domain-containing protein [Xylaria sp. FL1042]|nr:heterokaryon incompatibility protein-domain-containing protein [Xylaria sp. FL1042]
MVALNYTPLDPSRKEIRLLTLLNGEWNDKIKCKLYVASLDKEPKYEALSYVWGSQTDLVDIDVNGVTFSATQNLYAALRRLREQIGSTGSDENSRTLWVDAVCINQEDTDEKRHQVQLMGDIYSQTAHGLLWLGEEPDEPLPIVSKDQEDEVARLLKMSGDVLDEISASLPDLNIPKELSSIPEVKFRPGAHDFKITRTRPEHWDPKFDPSKLDQAGKLALEADSFYQVGCLLTMLGLGSHLNWIAHLQYEPEDAPATFRTNTRQALHWLGTRPWWTRIWTVQECILPRDSELLYGSVRIPWRRFLTGISNFQKHRTSCCANVPGINDMLNNLVDTVLPCLTLHRYCHNEDFSLPRISGDLDDPSHVSSLFRPESLLWTFRHREATDPRDKIYGILSLLKGYSTNTGQAAKDLIVPDYSPGTSFEKVFTRAVFNIINFSASLDIISQPGFVSRNLDLGLPSWVPDFSQSIEFAGSLDRCLKQLPCYNASLGRIASPSAIEENILVLEGCLVDTIANTSRPMLYTNEEPQHSVMREWHIFAKDFYKNLPESSSTPWKDRFWRTLCGDTIMTEQKVLVQEDFKAPLRRIPSVSASESAPSAMGEEAAYNLWCRTQGLEELGTRLPHLVNDGGKDVVGQSAVGNIGYAIKISTATRKLFVSTNGHLGLGPPIAGQTYPQMDRIFVFPGGKTPFILRYVGMRHVPGLGMRPCHELLGDCYLDKFMDGEGMRNFETKKQTVYIV